MVQRNWRNSRLPGARQFVNLDACWVRAWKEAGPELDPVESVRFPFRHASAAFALRKTSL